VLAFKDEGGTMKRFIVLTLVVCLSLCAAFAVAQGSEKEKTAITAAKKWLSLTDSGNYKRSWMYSAGYFRNSITEERWVQTLTAVRTPLGKLISREVKSAVYESSLPGVPDSEYVVIQFETSFENKKSAIETVTPMLEKDGKWRVSGYYIK
jgi:hypothetical protein